MLGVEKDSKLELVACSLYRGVGVVGKRIVVVASGGPGLPVSRVEIPLPAGGRRSTLAPT